MTGGKVVPGGEGCGYDFIDAPGFTGDQTVFDGEIVVVVVLERPPRLLSDNRPSTTRVRVVNKTGVVGTMLFWVLESGELPELRSVK